MAINYWLIKSEPSDYSFEDLKGEDDSNTTTVGNSSSSWSFFRFIVSCYFVILP